MRSIDEDEMASRKHVPWLLWPFAALWDLLTVVLGLTGRAVGVLLAMGFIAAGTLLCLTIVGAVVGVPVAILGLLLMIKCLF